VDTIWVVSSPQPLGAPCQTEPQRHHPWPWSCERTKRHASGWISTLWTEVLSETWQWKMMEHANYYRILHNRTIMCLRDFPSPSRNYQRVTNCQANSTKLRAPNASHPVKQICHPDWHHSAVAHKRLPTGRLCAAFGCPTMIQQGNKERLGKTWVPVWVLKPIEACTVTYCQSELSFQMSCNKPDLRSKAQMQTLAPFAHMACER
jgi:hypothetical protein